MPSRLAWSIATLGAVMVLADYLTHIPSGRIGVLTTLTLLGATLLSPRAWSRIFAAMLVWSIVQALIAIAQTPFSYRPEALFGSPNFFAGYAALHLFLALAVYREHPRLAVVAVGANIAALTLAQSRGAFLGAAAGLLLIVGVRRPKGIPALLLSGAVAWFWIFHLHAGMAEPRWDIWRQGLQIAKWRLLLGYGQQNFLILPNFEHLYNVALEMLVGAGIVGLAAGAWMLLEAGRAAAYRQRDEALALQALLLCWVVTGMFIYNTPGTVLPLYAALGYLAVNRDKADLAALVHNRQPLEDDAVGHRDRANRADRAHGGGAVRGESA